MVASLDERLPVGRISSSEDAVSKGMMVFPDLRIAEMISSMRVSMEKSAATDCFGTIFTDRRRKNSCFVSGRGTDVISE